MSKPVVSGGAVFSKVMLIGQAPGAREPLLGRPFAWTAGRTMFGWFEKYCGVGEARFRSSIYMAAVCRCFPGKTRAGGDRVPDAVEIANCLRWLEAEMRILRPALVIPVGKLAIAQLMEFDTLTEVIGLTMRASFRGHEFDMIPLPHPSGASPWHRIEPGRSLLERAMRRIARHPAFRRAVAAR